MAGKRIVNAYKTIDKTQAYALKEAVKIVKSNATAKFDETIDVAINLGVDPKHADQMIRGVCALPHGQNRTRRRFGSGRESRRGQSRRSRYRRCRESG